VPLIEALSARLKVPNAHRELAVLTARHHTLVHRAAELKPATILTLLENCDAFRRPERFAELLLACEADACGRTGRENEPYPQAAYLKRALAAAAAVTLTEQERRGLSGAAIGEQLRGRRFAAVSAVKAGAPRRSFNGPSDAPADSCQRSVPCATSANSTVPTATRYQAKIVKRCDCT